MLFSLQPHLGECQPARLLQLRPAVSVDPHLPQMMQLLLDSSTHAQEKQDKRRKVIERELEDEYQFMSLRGKGKADRPDEAQRAGLRQAQIQEGVRLRLEGIGYRLGYCLAERCVAAFQDPGAEHQSCGLRLYAFPLRCCAQACERKTANTKADGATAAASSHRAVSKPTDQLVPIQPVLNDAAAVGLSRSRQVHLQGVSA